MILKTPALGLLLLVHFAAPGEARAPVAPQGEAEIFDFPAREVVPNTSDLAWAQLNGDGIPDLVTTGLSGMALLIGRGDGTFLPAEKRFPSSDGFLAEPFDFDGDGTTDLLLGDSDGALQLMRGRGDARYLFAGSLTALPDPVSVKGGDLNGDGVADLACNGGSIFAGPSQLQVYLGQGLGQFGDSQQYRTSFASRDLSLADFDRDGALDAAVVSTFYSKATVLLNAGDGTFSGPVDVSVGANAFDLDVADLDLDGAPDLVVVGSLNDELSLRYGNGAGGFPDADDLDAGIGASSVEIGDLDADGLPELVVGGGFEGITVHHNEGGRVFIEIVDAAHSFAGDGLELVDLDGSGTLDACTLFRTGLHAYAYTNLGEGDGTFRSPAVTDLSAGLTLPFSADVDGDGVLDIIGSDFTTDSIYLLLVRPGKTFEQHVLPAVDPGRIATGDFNGDGALDLAYVETPTSVLHLALGQGDGEFVAGATVQLSGRPEDTRVLDADGDGLDDVLLISGTQPTDIELYRSDPVGGLALLSSWQSPARLDELGVGDWDEDGRMDFLTLETNSSNLRVYLNQGSGRFRAAGGLGGRLGTFFIRSTVGDVDGDGHLDLVISGQASDGLDVLYGTGTGRFVRGPAVAVNEPFSVVIGDLDQDGIMDLLAVTDSISVLLGNGDRTFRDAGTYAASQSTSHFILNDRDGDGDLDVIASGGSRITELENLTIR